MAERLRIQVCYALPGAANLTDVEVSEGQTLEAPELLPGFAVDVTRLFE